MTDTTINKIRSSLISRFDFTRDLSNEEIYSLIDNEIIEKIINSFEGLPHRLEKVVSKNGLVFYNSSKATNIASSIVDINAIEDEKIVLLGGSDKGENFKLLFKKPLKNVKAIVCYGKTKNKIFSAAAKFKNSTLKETMLLKAENLNEAINNAVQIAKTNKLAIVLAPACASFDEFKSYEERGEFFKEQIRKF